MLIWIDIRLYLLSFFRTLDPIQIPWSIFVPFTKLGRLKVQAYFSDGKRARTTAGIRPQSITDLLLAAAEVFRP